MAMIIVIIGIITIIVVGGIITMIILVIGILWRLFTGGWRVEGLSLR